MLEALDLDAVTSKGYVFQIEMTYRSLLAGFTVREVPIVFRDRREGDSKMSHRDRGGGRLAGPGPAPSPRWPAVGPHRAVSVPGVNLEVLAARAAALGGDRRIRLAAALVGFAAVTAVTALIAHPQMFFGFHSYDDEGYMLTALKAFVNHGHLYDQVFTQYGPFYYELWGGLFSIFGIPVTHDSGRTVVIVVWVLSGLLFGLGILKITRSIVLGLGTQILTFAALEVLTNEPMHPVGLIALLLAVIVVISTFVGERESPYPMALLGAAVAALALTKINVGFFAFASVALACAVSYRQLWERRWPRLLIEVIFVAIPVVLMTSKFGEGWARHYAIHVFAAALAVVIALRANQPARRQSGELRWLIGGFLVLAVVSCVAIIGAGTSIHGLYDGVIGQPLRQSNAFTIPMQLARRLYGFDLVALGGACAYWLAMRRRGGAGRRVPPCRPPPRSSRSPSASPWRSR